LAVPDCKIRNGDEGRGWGRGIKDGEGYIDFEFECEFLV
jgi:hypothetical protein